MTTKLLTVDEIHARAQAVRQAAEQRVDEAGDRQRAATNGYRYVRPLSSAHDSVLDVLAQRDRFTLGLYDLDVLTRGFGPKELILVTGFSHAGKTQLVNTAIFNNRDRRILFFSMDDPSEMILLKLASMVMGIDAEMLEQQLRNDSGNARAELKAVATHTFRNLIVVDESLGLGQMSQAVAEATTYWGEPPEMVALDYLGSMQGNGQSDEEDGGIKAKIQGLKRWVKEQPFPLIVLHQTSRRSGPGQRITMTSGAYGGEDTATILLGVRRKRDDESLDQWQRDVFLDTVTMHIVKNKRPPAKRTPADGIDFFMDPKTGVIRKLREDDLHYPTQPKVMRSAREVTFGLNDSPGTEIQ